MSAATGEQRPVGAVLAGGQSSRLGLANKALAELGGKPLLAHVTQRLAGQVSRIMISAQSTDPRLAAFGDELVVDVVQRHRGPLTGLCSALLRLECRDDGEWLLLCPCDAPFLPTDLAERLFAGAVQEEHPAAVASYQGRKQPVFSLWSRAVLPLIRGAVLERGEGGLMRVLAAIPHAVVEWPEQQPSPFFNVNTPEDLAAAQAALDAQA